MEILFQALDQRNFNVVRVIKDIDSRGTVKVGNENTKEIILNCLRGCITSLLFNIFLVEGLKMKMRANGSTLYLYTLIC